jgi:hypothetical protein
MDIKAVPHSIQRVCFYIDQHTVYFFLPATNNGMRGHQNGLGGNDFPFHIANHGAGRASFLIWQRF